MLLDLPSQRVTIASSAFVAPDAWIIGDVVLKEAVSIFFGAVLRGDIEKIVIGARSNIQEHCLIHTSYRRAPALIGEDVTVGHRAIIHGAQVCDRTLVGMNAVILDEAIIGEECIIGAGCLILEGVKIPPRSLVVGSPGRIVRQVSDAEVKNLVDSAARYVKTGEMYKKQLEF